jgi:hypothetical protein
VSVIQKAMQMPERELVAFAKTDAISKAQLSQLIDDLAQAKRARGESREIAFTKFVTEDALGRDLFQIMKAAPGRDHHQEAVAKAFTDPKPHMAKPGDSDDSDDDEQVDDDPLNGTNPFHAALQALAANLAETKEHAGSSPQKLYDHLARHDQTGKKLMTAATQWDLKRNATS